ncbi:MAG TPA: type II toxin-antitoxin system HicA family toxin [Fibrobacteria bacterium]|nr:type II toxin-antitoxin system HicA family toxin [Fibrobacteria bacterium]
MPISGWEMRRLFEKAGWVFHHQTGSHMIMKKHGTSVAIPNHKELGKGMEHKLFKELRNENELPFQDS